MRRSLALLVVLAACGGAVDAPATSQAPPFESPPATAAGDPLSPTSPTVAPGAPPTTDSGREPAPDFTLALGDGGSYTLSEGEKPVYLVFWAEW